MQNISFATNTYTPYRQQWLDLHSEEILDPGLPIIDAHHHLWDAPRQRYLVTDLMDDVAGGHRVVATVYVECRFEYRRDGPVPLRPLGEVEYATRVARQSMDPSENGTTYCDKIIGHADLTLGDDVVPVLEGLIAAGQGRLPGIRHSSAYDSDPLVIAPGTAKPEHLLLQAEFRQGFKHLTPLGLSFDAFMYHPQIPDLTALARSFPEANIILDHLGSPIGIGSYAGRREAVFLEWAAALAELALCPNVSVKLGGLGMQVAGFHFHQCARPPSSVELAAAWKPYIETCIDLFGPNRCMFESNFPPDKGTCSYTVLWNCFKRLTAGYSATEKAQLFHDTCARIYGIRR
jgi:predicted TIM-barrel fold metal-dependent hydrolase